jgi:hypothetical protein
MVLCVGGLFVGIAGLPSMASDSRMTWETKPGEPLFWTGPWVDETTHLPVEAGEGTDCEENTCWTYGLEVPTSGDPLHLGIQTADSGTGFFVFDVQDPHGTTVASEVASETSIADAERGVWKVLVRSARASNTSFRMRGLLGTKRLIDPYTLPDLRVTPPTRISIGGLSDGQCRPDEMVEHDAGRCLRLSFGPENLGGRLEVRLEDLALDPQTRLDSGDVYQRVYSQGGTVREVRIGSFTFHATHQHFHVADIISVTAYEVLEGGGLAMMTSQKKVGFCLTDTQVAVWDSFGASPAGSVESNCQGPNGIEMGISSGWADIYSAGTPGNYVEIPEDYKGWLLLRLEVNPSYEILEERRTNNHSFALLHVNGDSIRVGEKGYGQGPADPSKQVVSDWWN